MKIALVQTSLNWGNVDENIEHFNRLIGECRECDVILLPEMFVSGCMMVKQSVDVAEAVKQRVALRFDEVCEWMQQWAEEQDALVMGSTVYATEGKYYNRLIAAFPDKSCKFYDKRHCFRMGGENEHFSAGNKSLIFDFRGVRIAAFICYDLRFPVWCRNTARYDLAVFVANWPESRREVWKILLQARAIENQAYVAGVNCVGIDNNGLRYSGDSALVDPRGQRIGRAEAFAEKVVVAELDMEKLREFRHKFAVLDDRDHFELLINGG